MRFALDATRVGMDHGGSMRLEAAIAALWLWTAAAGCSCGELFGSGDPPSVVPAECTDDAALLAMSDWARLPVLGSGIYRQQSSEDRATGETPRVPLWRNGNRDMNNFRCASDDAEPKPGRDPFVLDQPRCAESYVRGYVMSRFEGSGRLARIWMTAASVRRGAADREVLRIYVDDQPKPLIQVPWSKALDGSAGEIFGTPFGAGSGRRMAWYYPVVFSTKLIVTLDRLSPKDLYFHQTAVVLDEQPRPRKRAAARLSARDAARQALKAIAAPRGTARVAKISLEPTERKTALELTGPATIVAVTARVATARARELEKVQLEVRWDHAEDAAIALPLLELFAAADSIPEEPSHALGARVMGDQLELALRLPMPLARRAEWSLDNQGETPVHFELALDVAEGVPSSPWGHLHVQAFETALPYRNSHPLVSASGPGRLAGVCMVMQGGPLKMKGMRGHAMNFLEGDELGVIDGQRALAGTGTEDYFNGAFYFEEGPSARAFDQVWGIEEQIPGAPGQARVNACRWHVFGDAIDFQSSLELDMEIGPGAREVLERYRSVAYLYVKPGR